MFGRSTLCAFLSALLLPGVTFAQSTWDEILWNPVPMEGDVVLPTECGGAITFRVVQTSVADNWLSDEEVQLGNSGIAGQEHSESIITRNLVGGLTKGGAAKRFYLIGKYEITEEQWAAVRATSPEECPELTDDGGFPAENMSWYDALDFTSRYTEWLYTHARAELEAAAGPGAFVRLPTEEEWEFAARGGSQLTKAERRKKLFAMDGPLNEYVWFAGHKSCDGFIQPVGLLQANPLGLFDILGNVQEMTMDMYQLRKRETAHGQIGGITARGGNCLTTENRVRVAARDEINLFDADTGKPGTKPFTGIRIVLGTTVLKDQGRITDINDSWHQLGDPRIEINPDDDPFVSLAKIADNEDNEDVRNTLLKAKDIFETEMERRNIIENRSAASVIQSGFLAVRSYVLTLDAVRHADFFLAGDPGNEDEKQALIASRIRMIERLNMSGDILLNAIVHAAEDFDAKTIADARGIVRDENNARLKDASETTRRTTAQMEELFAGFVAEYRTKSDTDPQKFFDEIVSYHARLIGAE